MSLDALFENDPVEDDVTAEVETEETEQVEPEETEEPEAKAEEPGETAKPEQDEESSWTKVAYLDEKRKRQEYENRVRELEKQLQGKEPEKPSLFDDPEGVLNSMKYELAANMSREFLMELKPDYIDREQQFLELAKEDPTLVQKLAQSKNPAKFAYETAVKAEWLKEVSDPVAYEAKVRAKILAEQKEQPVKKPSLAKTTSVGGTVDDSDMSLESILGR